MKIKRIISVLLALCLLSGSVFVNAEASKKQRSEPLGEGMCISVLAEGFYLEHESFTLTTETKKLSKEKSDTLLKSTRAISMLAFNEVLESAYVSDKIPFAYDYGDGDTDVFDKDRSDIGTAMISVAAGNDATLDTSNPGARGIAPEAQVLAMKVYSTNGNRVTANAMSAAIEDSVSLGADVILITERLVKGTIERGYIETVESALIKARKAGVAVICATGDVMPIGTSSIYEQYQLDVPTSAPDIGNIAFPASSKSCFAVGNAVSNRIVSPSFTLDGKTEIPFSDSNYLYKTTEGKSFCDYFDGRTLDYVIIGGVGNPEDFAASGDISGKLAVVSRGEISFSDKAKNAASAGAIGIIVTDTQTTESETLKIKMDLTDAPIPAILVPAVGAKYLALSESRKIEIKSGQTVETVTRSTPSVNSTSARGTSTELSPKPDVCAIGTAVECAAPDGTYTSIESSAAAAAKVTGMYALICQKLSGRLHGKELVDTVYAILVSSAGLMETNSELYSPRIQGGGCADIEAAQRASLILTSNGSHKIELGDKNGQILQFSLTASNISDADKLCSLDGIVGSDGYTVYSVAELDSEAKEGDKPYSEVFGVDKNGEAAFIADFTEFSDARIMIGTTSYQLNKSRADYNPYTFTLKSGESMTFDVSIYIDSPTYKSYLGYFTNGFFAEGFMRLASADESASIPFVGYCGSFSSSAAIDGSIYENGLKVYDGVYLSRFADDIIDSDDGRVILGMSARSNITENITVHKENIAFSPKVYDASNSIFLNMSLHRTVHDVKITVTDENGNIVSAREYDALARTVANTGNRLTNSICIPIWDGRAPDFFGYSYPQGDYTLTVIYKKPMSDIAESFSFVIRLDYTKPEYVSYGYEIKDGVPTLTVSAKDNHGIQSITVTDSELTSAVKNDDGSFDLTGLIGNYIYIDIFDYALNSTVVRIKNPALPDRDSQTAP